MLACEGTFHCRRVRRLERALLCQTRLLTLLRRAFELLVALDSLMQKNIVELALLIPFQIAMLVYSSVLPAQLHAAIYESSADTDSVQHRVRVYAIVIPCIIGAVTVVMAALVVRLYAEFGWAVFKVSRPELEVRNRR